MNRMLVVIALLLALVCMACLGVGALILYLQSTPVAAVTPPSASTAVAGTTPAGRLTTLAPTIVAPPTTAGSCNDGVTNVSISTDALVAPAFADNGFTVTTNSFANNFPQKLVFKLDAKSNASINQVALVVTFNGQASSTRQVPDFTPGNQVSATYEWKLPISYLPPGVSGQYWWVLQDSTGAQTQTPKQNFRVDDPNVKWKKIANNNLALYWYNGDNCFGKALFDRGVEAMKFLQQDTGVAVDNLIQIFIYGSRTDFFSALAPSAQEWTGGQAFTDYSIVVINIAPSNLEWGKQAMTHELTHQVIHQKIRGPLGDLSMPRWMDEGLAMYYETYPGTLDTQFSIPLKRAIQNDSLVTIRSIASAFPADPAAADLAYAQSYSVVDFIFRHYGKDKMAQLLQAFKVGGLYDDIFNQVLGVDTDGIEAAWRKDLGAKPRTIATRAVTTPSPFPTFSLSTDVTPVPRTATPVK